MRWFTSDQHLGHENIIGFCDRPFHNAAHMTEHLVGAWNERVAPDDDVWVLGDFAMGDLADTLAIAERLVGHKYLVPGNHDRCWPGGRTDWSTWIAWYENVGFTVVTHKPGETVTVGDFEVCHWPPTGDSRHGDRYAAWRPNPSGALLHGHIHTTNRGIADPNHPEWINVGVDTWDYAPVAETWLSAMIVG